VTEFSIGNLFSTITLEILSMLKKPVLKPSSKLDVKRSFLHLQKKVWTQFFIGRITM